MEQTGIPFIVYDCFTDTRFGGNVGAIIQDAGGLTPARMQQIAREMNAPVTGFVTARKGSEISIRFFMPAAEIAMCGHVTVGLFVHLFGASAAPQGYTLKTSAGDVPVTVARDDGGRAVVMMALSLPKPLAPRIDTAALAAALGVAETDIGQSAPVGGADAGLRHLFVPVSSGQVLRDMTPDFVHLATLSAEADVHTIACFSMDSPKQGKTLTLRDFCPVVGVNEAPASGTTNGALCGYLLQHGLITPEAQRICADQGRAIERPSTVISEIEVQDGQITALRVGGTAVLSLSGLLAPLDA